MSGSPYDCDVPGKPNHPLESGSLTNKANFSNEGPRPFFPPVCLRTHWNPTKIIERTLPNEYVPQALDPRPWVKVCLEYTTSGENGPAPDISNSAVLPMGGSVYPTSRYTDAIDNESALRRLDRPLGTCDEDQYYPNRGGDMFNQRILVPYRITADPSKISELALPRVARTIREYECRAKDDVVNTALSTRRFNNTTKQDRYKLLGKV
jgi:hypothetical protein